MYRPRVSSMGRILALADDLAIGIDPEVFYSKAARDAAIREQLAYNNAVLNELEAGLAERSAGHWITPGDPNAVPAAEAPRPVFGQDANSHEPVFGPHEHVHLHLDGTRHEHVHRHANDTNHNHEHSADIE